MSTEFNPNIPSNDDTVYDAYFSFHKNMEALNNLIGVDHFNGSALSNRGMHRAITFPEPLDSQPAVQGTMGVLYTGQDSTDPTSLAPVLKYTNAKGTWEIPLGAASGGGGSSSTAQQSFEETVNPNLFEGKGFLVFPNKFGIFWARGVLNAGQTVSGKFDKEIRRVFFAQVVSTQGRNIARFTQTEDTKDKFLSWEIVGNGFRVSNAYKTWSLNYQILVIGLTI